MGVIDVSEDRIRTRPKLVRKLRLLMFLGLIGGPVVFGIGLFKYLEMKNLTTKGATVEGTVVDTSILQTGKGREVFRVVADYHPEGFPIHRKLFTLPRVDYEQAQKSGKISVIFLPAKPAVSAAGTSVRPDNEPMAIGVGVFLVALVIGLYFRKKGREIETAIYGEAQPAASHGPGTAGAPPGE